MKHVCIALSFVLCLASAFAGTETVTVGEKEYKYYVAPDFITSTSYEEQLKKVMDALKALTPEAAKLNGYSDNTTVLGNARALERLTKMTEGVAGDLIAVIEKYTPSPDKPTSALLADLKARLEKVAGYNFGPTRSETFEIFPISNETKGEIEVLDGKDADGNEVFHTARYAVTPGLKDTIQNEREIVVIDRLPEGGYKIATGIFYPGQNKVVMRWDERLFKNLEGFLKYHNVCPAQKKWLKSADGGYVPYSENKRK